MLADELDAQEVATPVDGDQQVEGCALEARNGREVDGFEGVGDGAGLGFEFAGDGPGGNVAQLVAHMQGRLETPGDVGLVQVASQGRQTQAGEEQGGGRCRPSILADATGHGLSAAVSVLPMVQEFYRLVELSTPLSTLVESINFLLANSLPLGRFVAAAFVVLDQREGQGEIWVGGVPDVLLFGEDGRLQRRFGSSSLPLGILKTTEIAHAIEHFTWQSAGQLMLVSDGIVEASNAEDVAFGEARLIETLESRTPGLAMSEALQQSLQAYLGGSVAHDDMSMLVIDCPRAGSIA